MIIGFHAAELERWRARCEATRREKKLRGEFNERWRLGRSETRAEAMRLRSEGASFREIGDRLCLSPAGARLQVVAGLGDPLAYVSFVVQSVDFDSIRSTP
jgi:hypothetical protein